MIMNNLLIDIDFYIKRGVHMKKINFEPIGKAMQAFDTDKMDYYYYSL